MKIRNITKGFTLIELLVVITIIGILATGAVTVYTSQIQKSRDSVRITDIKAVQSGIEQYYQDNAAYPIRGSAFSGVRVYTPKLPQDPKTGQTSTRSSFDYLYSLSKDTSGVSDQEYEISTTFEQTGNISSKASNDGGDDNNRLEIGININDTRKSTNVKGIISAPTLKCVAKTGGAAATCNASNPMVIKN